MTKYKNIKLQFQSFFKPNARNEKSEMINRMKMETQHQEEEGRQSDPPEVERKASAGKGSKPALELRAHRALNFQSADVDLEIIFD